MHTYMYTYMHKYTRLRAPRRDRARSGLGDLKHTCHFLPPSEIDLGLCLAVFAGSGGKYLFHRIG